MCRRRCYHCKPSDVRYPRLVRGRGSTWDFPKRWGPPAARNHDGASASVLRIHLRVHGVHLRLSEKKFSLTRYYIIITVTLLLSLIIIIIISSSSLFYDVSIPLCTSRKTAIPSRTEILFPKQHYYTILLCHKRIQNN